MTVIKRIFAALLSVSLLLGSAAALSSCGENGPAALEYEGVRVSEKLYAYWMAHYKHAFLTTYRDASDTDEFWNSTLENGQTAEEYLTSVVNRNVSRYAAAAWLFDYMKLKLTSGMKKEVENGIDEICQYSFGGDKEKFNEYLAEIGIDRDTLYDAYIMDVKLNYVKEYLYGVSGVINVPDSDRMAYLEEKYVRIAHIYVNDKFKWETDEDGEYVTDEDGHGKKRGLTEDEAASAAETIDAVRRGLENGTDFGELWEEYSEDKLYPGGYYLLPTTSGFFDEVVSAAFGLEIGETRELETEYGVHFIKRYKMEGTPWNDSGSADFFGDFEDDMRSYLFTVMIDEVAADVTVNEDITGAHKLRDAAVAQYV